MTRPAIPSRDEVLTALALLQVDSENTGRQPAVLTLDVLRSRGAVAGLVSRLG